MTDADAPPDPAAEIARLKRHRTTLIRWGTREERLRREAQAEVERLREQLAAKEVERVG